MVPSCLTTFLAVALVLPFLRAGAQDTTTSPHSPPNEAAPSTPPVQINGLVQVWYLDGHTITNAHDTYRVRRADIKLSGVISPRVGWHVSLDGAKVLNLTKNTTVVDDSTTLRDTNIDQRSRILQEASIYVAVTPTFRIDVGQQIIPVSLEGVTPSSQIETIERTMFIAERTRGGGISDVRDIGAAARGSVAAGYVDYQIGLFNEMGDSQNSTDQNDQKALIGRVAFHLPVIPELRLGVSGGSEGGAVGQRHERAGGEVQYRNRWITLRSEVMGARDGVLRRLGYYGFGAIRPAPQMELVARWDNWDPDLHNESGPADVFEREIVAGANYFIDGSSTRLAANVIRSTFPSGRLPSTTLLLFALQVAW
ncbi:MAG TPA: porin [Gemmatimonadaceae bacterium]|nr:porin [Gemmatimonadaceae bacterium]